MLLRSSSSPILRSLLSSSSNYFADNPSNGSQLHNQLQNLERTSSCSSHNISCRFSLLSESSDRDFSTGIRRSWSEGNIKDLSSLSDLSHGQRLLKTSSSRPSDLVLETIPSFSVYSSMGVEQEQWHKEQEENQEATDFRFSNYKDDMGFNMDERKGIQLASQPLFLARGLGIDRVASGFLNIDSDGSTVFGGVDGGNCGNGNASVKTDYGGEGYEAEVFYKRMIEEDPSNAMVLRNYAQFLHQCKGDLQRAEEYYSRAILADPGDADAFSKYGNLVWELRGDFERALSYLQRAANMNQENCFVQAAYASFLWDNTEEDEDNQSPGFIHQPFHVEALATT